MSEKFLSTPALTKINNHIAKTIPHGGLKAFELPGCPLIKLYLFDPERLDGPLSHEVAQAVVANPAYWSFCWASGQALSSFIMAHPELVAGKVVCDFGCGSGVAGIAAKIAGAKTVIACDIDSDALDAARANAELNNVELDYSDDWFALTQSIDVVVAADVLYDPDNRVFLDEFKVRAESVLLADSRIKHLADDRYQILDVYTCRTWPDLHEFEEFNKVRIYQAN